MATKQQQDPPVHTRGTMVIALGFLAFFVIMILVNFRLLSEAWPIR